MKITKLETQKRAMDRMNVFIDGEFRLALATEVVLAAGLRTGATIAEADLEALAQRDQHWKAKEAALRLLSFRPRTAAELRRRLREKQFAGDVVDACVARLVETGLVQDSAFADMFVRDRTRLRPQGRRRLVQELRMKGVDAATAQSAIDATWSAEQTDETGLARQAARKWRRKPGEDVDRARRRLYGLLARRGFGADAIRAVIDEACPRDGSALDE
jgi:regulatory protein